MKELQRVLVTLVGAAALVSGLSACAPLVLGGAAVSALVFMDRRTSGAQLEDEGIEMRASDRISALLGERGHVNVNSYNRQVLLTGEVPDAQKRQQVEALAGQVENVRGVVNELVVALPSSLSQRSNDLLITGKVKAALVDARDLSAAAFKVVTEHGVVYLMGRVTQREADRATQVVRNVGGVQKVVRILEIISEDDLARITHVPAATPAAR